MLGFVWVPYAEKHNLRKTTSPGGFFVYFPKTTLISKKPQDRQNANRPNLSIENKQNANIIIL